MEKLKKPSVPSHARKGVPAVGGTEHGRPDEIRQLRVVRRLFCDLPVPVCIRLPVGGSAQVQKQRRNGRRKRTFSKKPAHWPTP